MQITDPSWTDFSPGNSGVAIIETVAFVGDGLNYYQDRQLNEAFLITAVERQNVINHLRGVGYELSTATASSVNLSASLASPLGENFTWPRLSVVTTQDGQTVGETMGDVFFAAGSVGPFSVTWVEGTTYSESLGMGTGLPGQTLQLAQTPYLFGSEQFIVDGVAWTRVRNLLNSLPNDRVYVVQVAADDTASIVTGDGINGMAPMAGSILRATYRTGGGNHNVDQGMLNKLESVPIAGSGATVPLIVTNPLAASGGAPRETIDHAKLYGPASIRTGSRSVAKDDYETNSQAVPGVARALALSKNEDPTIEENTVDVFIVPSGGGAPSAALISAVQTQLTVTTPKTLTTRLNVFAALYRVIAPGGVVYVQPLVDPVAQTQLLVSAASMVQAVLVSYFDPANLDLINGGFTNNFGSTIGTSRIIQLVQDSTGVLRLTLTTPPQDVALLPREYPILPASTVVQVSPTRVDLVFAATALNTTPVTYTPTTVLEFIPST